jgi:hypothetical protein
MRKDTLFDNFKLKATSLFDMTELYKKLFKWFEVYGYDFWEKEFKDIDEPSGKHIEIFWEGRRKIDEYIMFVIEISYLILGMKDVEVEKGGIKLKTQKCALEFRISSYLLMDYDDKWSKTGFHKSIRNVYDKYVARERIDRLENELVGETNSMIEEIKAFMSLHKF